MKSTSLLGGATAFNVLLGMGRVKCVALLLGPAGLGMMGAYQSIITVTTSLAGMGLAYSGVREVAEARGSGDERRLWDTVATFRQLSRWLGVIGMVGLAALAWPVSHLTFKSGEHWMAIMVLASVVWCSLLSSYHMAIIQSAQEIGRLARLNMISGLVGTAVSLACFAMWGQGGVVPALAAGGIVQWSLAWYFARGLFGSQIPVSAVYTPAIAGQLVKFGGLMLMVGVVSSVAAYVQRVIILRQLGADALGMIQAAEGLSTIYAGYILGAMGTDFLPRLSAVTGDREKTNQLVNEQTVVALLLGTPGLIITIVLAPTALSVLYSTKFDPAAEPLRLLAVGVWGRLVSWPLSFLLLARGNSLGFWLNVLASLIQLVVLALGIASFGLMTVAGAVILMYVTFLVTNYCAAARVTGFSWSAESKESIIVSLGAIVVVMATSVLISPPWDIAAGGVLLSLLLLRTSRKLSVLMHVRLVKQLHKWILGRSMAKSLNSLDR